MEHTAYFHSYFSSSTNPINRGQNKTKSWKNDILGLIVSEPNHSLIKQIWWNYERTNSTMVKNNVQM